MIKVSEERRLEVERYFEMPPTQRPTVGVFRKSIHMGAQTFRDLKFEYELKKEAQKNDAGKLLLGYTRDVEKHYKGKIAHRAVSDTEILAFRRKLYDDAMQKDASKGDKELLARSLGLLVDKQEVTHYLTPELIEKSRQRADIELRESGNGVYEVPEVISLLPPELCKDTG